MNFDFGEVLSRAWQIIWKHKVLWIFGILAGCSGGGGNSLSQRTERNNNPETFNQIQTWVESHMAIVIAIIIALLIVGLLLSILRLISRIALIKGTKQADQGAERLSFMQLFSESLPYFWRIFGIGVLIFLIVLLTLAPFFIFSIFTAGMAMLCLIPALCVLFPLMIVLGIVTLQAQTAIILEDLSMTEGIKRGWEVAKSNAGPIFIMWLILGLGGGIFGIILALPFFVALAPILFGVASKSNLAIVGGIICMAAYLPVLFLVNGVLVSYIQAAWTLTYMRLTTPKVIEPLVIEANA